MAEHSVNSVLFLHLISEPNLYASCENLGCEETKALSRKCSDLEVASSHYLKPFRDLGNVALVDLITLNVFGQKFTLSSIGVAHYNYSFASYRLRIYFETYANEFAHTKPQK